jgi:hypothetical protein
MASPEILIVVRRGDAEIVRHLREEFAGPELAVIVDRRLVERRRVTAALPADRRQAERRDRPVKWNALGFMVQRRGRPGGVHLAEERLASASRPDARPG